MLAILLIICCLGIASSLPIVDPGLFVIMGVKSCREGSGYCLLGLDCTLDEDFLPDDKGGHCNGLRSAFTPSAHFVCCRYNSGSSSPSPVLNATSVILDNHLMDGIPAILLSMGSENSATSGDSTEMDFLTTETYKTTTDVAEELSKNVLEEDSHNHVQLKSYSNFEAEKSADASISILTDKGIISQFPSATEVNLDLVVHDNIHERSVNNESTTSGDVDATTVDMCDQDEGCWQDSNVLTSTIETLGITDETLTENYEETRPQHQNMNELESTTVSLGILTTTEMYPAEQTLNLESKSSAEILFEQEDFEAVTDPLLFRNGSDLASDEEYVETVAGQQSSQSTDSAETVTVPSTESKLATEGTTVGELATTEPVRSNEISPEQEDNKSHPSTTVTASCSGTVGRNCWLVKFMNSTSTMCLGSFLRNDIILTAANCVSRIFDLGLSAITLQTVGGTVVPRNLIRDVIVHEEYKTKLTKVALNDLGLVRLESAVKLTPSICTLCLPNSETDLMDKPCDRMSKKYNKKYLELPGSPMVCQGSTLGGVVSFYSPEPIYTPISDYLPWIRQNMEIIDIPVEWQK